MVRDRWTDGKSDTQRQMPHLKIKEKYTEKLKDSRRDSKGREKTEKNSRKEN